MVMISTVIRCHPATFGALSSCVEGSLPELEQSFMTLTIRFCTRREGVLQMLL
jgi:hypothetical protein